MSLSQDLTATAVRIVVRGRVQGVGFRPALARLAQALSLSGEVRNTGSGVEIVLEGESADIERFRDQLRLQAPALAQIADVEVYPACPRGRTCFSILPGAPSGPIRTPPPPDLTVCRECLAEVSDAKNRRAGYPFTSCVQCGPRYSVLRALPYERSATSLAEFLLCDDCRCEYEHPADRRFHAETTACSHCGPMCWLADAGGVVLAKGNSAVPAAIAALRRGKIVALRGIGGYQLLVDATNDAAVRTLRERKQRPAKPLAVLVESLAAAQALAHVTAPAVAVLTQPAGPIVVLPARANSLLAPAVHPGLGEVGLMLPTSPLHWLLVRGGPPLVATSGNREGDPLEYECDEARATLTGIADFILDHDRPIARPIDDSVVRMIAGKPVTLRLARGLAPLPLNLIADRCLLAAGGQQSNAVAVTNEELTILGPHAGDLDTVRACQRWIEQQRGLCAILETKPELIVHDPHPDYFTTRWAAESRLPTVAVQHHHAHIAAGMLEQGWLDREVLGVAWDGTGFGTDGTIWGGEFLRANAADFRRVARLRRFPLVGGEAAIREPWRVALALLTEALGPAEAISFLAERGWSASSLVTISQLTARQTYSPRTSSVGRLFDAVATLALPYEATNGGTALHEGQLAMYLESACCWPADINDLDDIAPYSLPLVGGETAELDWRPLVAEVVADCRAATPISQIARRFHAALAEALIAVAGNYPALPIVLAGGVFQNRVLTELVVRRFVACPHRLGLPGVIPPGDGGLAAGQLVVALARLGNQPRCA